MFWRFSRRFEVQNLRSGFSCSLNMNLSMRFRSGELLNRTPNPQSGPGSDPVLEVREPDHSQSTYDAVITIVYSLWVESHEKWTATFDAL